MRAKDRERDYSRDRPFSREREREKHCKLAEKSPHPFAGDLKPANIFLMRDGCVKVGDLGLGRLLNESTSEAYSKVGTPLYMSPEALMGTCE